MQNRRKFLKFGALIASASIAHPLASFSIPTNLMQQGKLVPLALKKGDKVVIISPAGAVYDVAKIKEFKNTLINLGFVVTLAKSVSKTYGYLAGSDEERAADVNEAFADKSIKGIFCTRGGWGCARILDLLDYKSIADNPKFIMGFSDITSLLIGINTKVKAWNHWITAGKKEGRIFFDLKEIKNFDWKIYINNYPDLYKYKLDSFGKAYEHWVTQGKIQERTSLYYNTSKINYYGFGSSFFINMACHFLSSKYNLNFEYKYYHLFN